jgi:hypothetical protein
MFRVWIIGIAAAFLPNVSYAAWDIEFEHGASMSEGAEGSPGEFEDLDDPIHIRWFVLGVEQSRKHEFENTGFRGGQWEFRIRQKPPIVIFNHGTWSRRLDEDLSSNASHYDSSISPKLDVLTLSDDVWPLTRSYIDRPYVDVQVVSFFSPGTP